MRQVKIAKCIENVSSKRINEKYCCVAIGLTVFLRARAKLGQFLKKMVNYRKR